MAERRAIIFLSAAEPSGDDHAAGLILALRQRLPDARFVGAAGPKMAAAGCEVIIDLTHTASMLLGPIGNLVYYWQAVRKIQKAIRDLKPSVHVPVDSPALNWHLAKTAKKVGTPVMYYIAPQVWAWAPWRISKVRRLTDRLGCILPFEEEYFRPRGIRADYVGHPLFDHLPAQRSAGECPDLTKPWLDGTWRVALLPGSRPGEIKHHVPALVRTGEAIRNRWAGSQCTFTAVTEDAAKHIRAAAGAGGAELTVAVGRTSEVLARSHFAVAVSGTVTLQVAHFGVPMVILYRTGRFGYHLLGRWILRTRQLSLVNILAGRKIVPELMPWHGSVPQVIDAVMDVMGDLGWLVETRGRLLELTRPLAVPPPGSAAANAADIIIQMLEA